LCTVIYSGIRIDITFESLYFLVLVVSYSILADSMSDVWATFSNLTINLKKVDLQLEVWLLRKKNQAFW